MARLVVYTPFPKLQREREPRAICLRERYELRQRQIWRWPNNPNGESGRGGQWTK